MKNKSKLKKIVLLLILVFVIISLLAAGIFWMLPKYVEKSSEEKCTAFKIIDEVEEASISIKSFLDDNPRFTEVDNRLIDKYAILPVRMLGGNIGELENSCNGSITISGESDRFSLKFEGIPQNVCADIMKSNEKDASVLQNLELVGKKNRICHKCPKEGCTIEWKYKWSD